MVISIKPAPSPGDAFRFLKASQSHIAWERSYLHQCTALLSSGQCCEKIFCNPSDIRSHMLKNHGTDSFEFRQKFFIDAHDNLYILWFQRRGLSISIPAFSPILLDFLCSIKYLKRKRLWQMRLGRILYTWSSGGALWHRKCLYYMWNSNSIAIFPE